MFAYFAGSKDETFFDSQPWLESDCEDDFFSVNGGKKLFELTCLENLFNFVFQMSYVVEFRNVSLC